MKISIVEAWGTLSNDEEIAYAPQLKQMVLVTPQYDEWLRESNAERPLMGQSEEVKKLMAIIEAKDKENAQLRQSVEMNKGLAEKNKKLCEEMQKRYQELKKKVFLTIATQRRPIITRSRSRALRQPANTSSIPETSERSAMVTSPDFTALRAQLNEESHHHVAEPFVLDTASQGKAAIEEQPAPIDKDLLRRLDRFDDFMKQNQGLSRHGGLDYDELCLFLNIQLPLGFKTPKFSKYDGTENPKTHLKMFGNKLGKPVDDENLPMRLFLENLEGDALDWYSNLKSGEVKTWLDLLTVFVKQYEFNCELAPTRTTLEGTKRKPSEDHKTYGKRWRKLAAKVQPPMTEE
nr:uncharacterized protein LOC113739250 [Coffea arabica]